MDEGSACADIERLWAEHRGAGLRRASGCVAAVTCGDCRFVDEFELIRRCFRDRATRHPGTVLGIGDDAALLDTGGVPLVHARATVPFSNQDDGARTARRVFAVAFVRLAAQAVTPRWATLGLTLDRDDPDRIESFAAAAAGVSGACGVDLIGGDTTRGPGRATVFALGSANALPRRIMSPTPTGTVEARVPLATDRAPMHAIADLVSVCTDLAARGADLRCDDPGSTSDNFRAGAVVLVARTNPAGLDALRGVAALLRPESGRLAPRG